MNSQVVTSNTKKILVVDDNEIILKTLAFTLKGKGYQVLTATSGPDAMGAVRRETPDLILLDINFPPDIMNISGPLLDGFQIIDWLDRSPEIKKTPIIIISGTDPAEYKDRTSLRIVAAFKKPLNRPELLAAIESAFAAN